MRQVSDAGWNLLVRTVIEVKKNCVGTYLSYLILFKDLKLVLLQLIMRLKIDEEIGLPDTVKELGRYPNLGNVVGL